MSVPPEEIAYQKANASDFNADGLSAFCISGVIIVTAAVMLRIWSRKLQKIPLQADDYTLVVSLVLSVTSVILFDVRVYHHGMGRHYYSLSVQDQIKFKKIDYAFNLFYTTGYPLSRISLVLLYHRIFVQQWFRIICWFFVCVFSGYMISTVIIDSLLTIPVSAYWDSTITPARTVDLVKLYIANAAFNIATDSILLILPMTIIWRLSMNWMQKLGLTAIFCTGALTLVASIARLVFFYQVRPVDISYTLIPIVWWTSAELFLGILCPCLVTFRPILRRAYSFFSSRISTRRRGYSKSEDTQERFVEMRGLADKKGVNGSWSRKSTDYNPYHSQQGSQKKLSPYPISAPVAASLSRDKDGMVLDENAALANLDPRIGGRDMIGQAQPLGTRSEVNAEQQQKRSAQNRLHLPRGAKKGAGTNDDEVAATPMAVPEGAIGFQRDYKLENHGRY